MLQDLHDAMSIYVKAEKRASFLVKRRREELEPRWQNQLQALGEAARHAYEQSACAIAEDDAITQGDGVIKKERRKDSGLEP